uniref:hypothetical protein n=1 Tax=Gillisia sp. CAL575 TaxID=985255 RepID=UPI000556EC47
MKHYKINFLILFCVSFFYTSLIHSQNDEFKVEVFQNGKNLKLKKGKYKLKKEPFKFRITLLNSDHVYVSSSWGNYYYDYPGDENIFECNDKDFLKDCRFVAIKTGNEDKFNVNK